MLTRVLAELGPELAPHAARDARDAADGDGIGRCRASCPRSAERREDLRGLAEAAGPAGARAEDLRRLLVGADRGVRESVVGAPRRGSRRRPLRGRADRRLADRDLCAIVLVLSDEVERAEALLADIRADARARGSIISHLVDLAWGAFLRLRTGDLRTAAEDAAGRWHWRAESTPAGSRSGWSPACATPCANRASSNRPHA